MTTAGIDLLKLDLMSKQLWNRGLVGDARLTEQAATEIKALRDKVEQLSLQVETERNNYWAK